jgi:hypothetical protein
METRQSRMEKYYNDEPEVVIPSRLKKNKELYKEVSNLELDGFDVNSNASVIGDNDDIISLDQIKGILKEKYQEEPRNKSFGDTDEVELPKIKLDETREYDINSILKKVEEEKEIDYEEDRLKKIRNTQYDILKDLNINKAEDEEEKDNKENKKSMVVKQESEQELTDLINTITAKELMDGEKNLEVTGEMDPLDILSDLRGDEDTKVLGALVDDVASDEDTLGIEKNDIEEKEKVPTEDLKAEVKDALLKRKDEELKLQKNNVDSIDQSFIGKTTMFKESDFDDFSDLREENKFGKIIINVMIIIIILIFLAGLVVLANKYLGLGLF